jgi:hypothetical protein
MTARLARRIERLETIIEERRLAPVRDRVAGIMRRLGAALPLSEVEDIVRQYVGVAEHIKGRVETLRGGGMADEAILGSLPDEMAARLGVDAEER